MRPAGSKRVSSSGKVRIRKIHYTFEDSFDCIKSTLEGRFYDITSGNEANQVYIREVFVDTFIIAFYEKESISGDVVGAKGAVLASGLAFFVIDCASRIIPNFVAGTEEHHRPINFFVV